MSRPSLSPSSSTLVSSAVVSNKTGTNSSMVNEEYLDEEEDESIVLMDEYSSRKTAADVRTPSLSWCTSSHYRLTRRGKVYKNVSERYLREDIGLGCCYKDQSTSVVITSEKELVPLLIDVEEEEDVNRASPSQQEQHQQHLLICDANVLIHNMDLLEHPLFVANLVIPQTSLEECKRNSSLSHYNRIMELLLSSSSNITRKGQRKKCAIFFPNIHHADTYNLTTSDISLLTKRLQKIGHPTDTLPTDNDKNDLRIRKVATYYGYHLNPKNIQVILVTDDQQCRKLAQLEQQHQTYYNCHSVREYVTQQPNRYDATTTSMLLDVISFHTANVRSTTSSINTTSIDLFEPYVPLSDITTGIKVGTYYQGILRCADRSSYDKCYVTIRGTNTTSNTADDEDRVAVEINGITDVNRAVDGDMVAIQLHPVHLWNIATRQELSVGPSSNLTTEDDEPPKIAMDTAEPTIQDEDNVQEIILVPASIVDSTTSKEGVTQPDMSNVSLRSLKPTGKVIGILRRNFRQNYCGSIYSHAIMGREIKKEDGNEDITSSVLVTSSEREEIAKAYEEEHADGTATCVFFAVDKRVPPILIRTSQRERLLGQRILVAMDSWPITSRYPLGHYVKALGSIGNVSVETQVVLHEFNIPCDPFPAKVLACLPPPDYKIEMDPSRLDLRGLPVLSIDPPGMLGGFMLFSYAIFFSKNDCIMLLCKHKLLFFFFF